MEALLLIIAILCAILALLRNAVAYYYKQNDRLSDLEMHFIFKWHKIYGGIGLLALVIYAFFVPFTLYLGCALGGYVLGSVMAMVAFKKANTITILSHQAFMIFGLLFMLFQLFAI